MNVLERTSAARRHELQSKETRGWAIREAKLGPRRRPGVERRKTDRTRCTHAKSYRERESVGRRWRKREEGEERKRNDMGDGVGSIKGTLVGINI